MNVTAQQLQKIMGCTNGKAALYAPLLNDAMAKYQINTPKRIQAFLAQVGHESGRLVYVKELASGQAYECRKDLGNVCAGDGVRYKGRGLIQITGRTNYAAMAKAFGIDCLNHPEILEQPAYACLSAAWFWSTHGLNELADAGDYTTITKRINGGTNGLSDRLALYETAKKVIA